MDKKTKILNMIFGGLVIISISITFYKTIFKKDFIIINYNEEDSIVEDTLSDVKEEIITETIE